MDLDKLKEVQTARSAYIKAANANLPEVQRGNAEQLMDRYVALAEKMAKYVEHNHWNHPPQNGKLYHERVSGSRMIGMFENPLPEVRVRFRYAYVQYRDGEQVSGGGPGLNEHNEDIRFIQVEFIHSEAGAHAEPTSDTNTVPTRGAYGAGEIFASESLSFSSLRFLEDREVDTETYESVLGTHPSVVLRLLEESMDQYEATPPSQYEISEGLV